ncbi:manganese efflux pump [Limnochorda pilosa]|uniref:Sporulation protein YtaF n=1 Tax=Limnochorda pilosa TaxID=1555112 RepID=A0A0K2SRD8_LIMPI|nr:manganese efflux pump [Limnochorda pilosa]BAS29409.1 sporulation protein YtaF [Limnochorda pilosa]
MNAWEVLSLVVALSLDGFFVGLSFGARRIQVPGRSLLTLAACSAVGLGASMAAARLVTGLTFVSGRALSGWVLLAVGLWRLLQGWGEAHAGQKGPLLSFSLPQVGLVIQVLVDPARADRDLSGRIEPAEALILGVALSLDAVGVGLAMAGLPVTPLLPAWVGLGLYTLTRTGMELATRLGARWSRGRQRLLPGLILVILGLAQIGRVGP